MFRIKKTFEIAASHALELPYESKCCQNHGHNFLITVYSKSMELDMNGMVVDFTEIKRKIQDVLDHQCLNDIKDLGWEDVDGSVVNRNPTAERIAEWICYQIPSCYRVDVQESEGNTATYEDESIEE